MKRKVGLTLLALLLSLSMFGCSSDGSSSSGKGKNSGLRMLMPYSRFDPNKDFMASYIQEKTGVQVNYEMLPAENFDEKLNLLVANKEPIDIMKLSSGQFYQLASSGALEPLDELIDEHGDYIKSAIKDSTWGSATIDGKIYAIPEAGSGASAGEALVVRQDWMDELGLEAPKNPEELYTVLKTIKEKKQIVPLTGAKDSIYGDIASAFGIVNDWEDQNGKLVHKAEHPRMKEFLSYMNRLYEEGLIDQEMPINTAAKAIEKFTSGKAAMYKLAWWNSTNTVNSLKQNFPDAKLSVIPYLQDADGKASVGINTGITWFIAIPKASKHKEEAMKLLNAKLAPDVFKGLAIGDEGVHHELKDGKYYPILPKFNEDLTNGSSYMTGTDEHKYPEYWQARVRKEPILQSYFEAFQKEAEGHLVIDPMSLAPPIDAVNKNKLKLMKLLDDNVLKFITGAEPVANYDQVLEQWYAEGGKDMVKQANDWYTNR
ncbi:extracellular solute-binding protein [Paenibacillus aquistagni]|uniref:Carbohydrate ABC transporter substrate-binding protein, CUT1 family n=1 Tax=Paenibacillus aquistagni TaxID=1852522 RepID=A0A1X7IVW1_9BACL|nr:extracellular solute-binding protein [Paenibacillus aquistagni]SMG19034.1 carbohydrate ABC transporter substrate-binding protein, CUT1 family [Paenibacillus aquistagni]